VASLDGQHYEAVIIGAGMAGLAAGIRLALFDKRVLILERHEAPGGLNSFYRLGGRNYDVGLHAMTNFAPRGTRGAPLSKLLRQLRIPYEAFDLREQRGSRIAFPGVDLRFANSGELLEAEVAERFPGQIDAYRGLVAQVRAFDDTALEQADLSARAFLEERLKEPLLREMLLLPLLYYGSAREHDMELAQFVTMFKAVYLEGFARPPEGVRTIIKALLAKYRSLGGERRMRAGVARLEAGGGCVRRVVLDNGETVTADTVLSSAGAAETLALCAADGAGSAGPGDAPVGRLSFVETILVMDRPVRHFGWEETIIFFNDSKTVRYARPEGEVDPGSGVICFPENYAYGEGEGPPEGLLRITALANFEKWAALNASPEAYRARKEHWFARLRQQALDFLPPVAGGAGAVAGATLATDMFTPTTVTRYTGHFAGAIYGSPHKIRDGRTPYANLHLIGTDQGFLGITGAMLSGISMANLHVLSPAAGGGQG